MPRGILLTNCNTSLIRVRFVWLSSTTRLPDPAEYQNICGTGQFWHWLAINKLGMQALQPITRIPVPKCFVSGKKIRKDKLHQVSEFQAIKQLAPLTVQLLPK